LSDTKYGQHIEPIPVVAMTGKGNDTEGWDLWGKDQANFEANIAMRAFNEIDGMDPEYQQRPQTHGFDEVPMFLSSDVYEVGNPGLKAEMRMGREEEKHIIDAPTAFWVTKGLPYYPIF
jgi:hypothetical protein